MALPCMICSLPHDERLRIDRQLIRGVKVGSVASDLGLPSHVVSRHKNKHIHVQLATAYDKKNKNLARTVTQELDELVKIAKSILTKAQKNGHNTLSLAALKELRGQFELMSKIAWAKDQAMQANQLHGLTMEEVQEFREWKYAKDNPSDPSDLLQLDTLTDEEREFIFSISMKKLAASSGVSKGTTILARSSAYKDSAITDVQPLPDEAEICSSGSRILKRATERANNKIRRTK